MLCGLFSPEHEVSMTDSSVQDNHAGEYEFTQTLVKQGRVFLSAGSP